MRKPTGSAFLLLTMACCWFVALQLRGQEGAPAASTEAPTSPAGGDRATSGGEPSPGEEAEGPIEGDPTASVEEGADIIYGKIDGEINLVEAAYVGRLLREAKAAGAETLVIELNTFGGRVDAAVTIRDALIDSELQTVMFINKRAISAGALISLACNKIAISPGGTIGAATPVQSAPGAEMPAPVEEKYVSYFREEMRVTAETNGRDGDVAEAMVDADMEVEGVSEAGKLLTLSTRRALETGIADVEARSIDEALEKLGISGTRAEVARSWSEVLVGFLTSSAVASLLFLGMIVMGYLEYQTPGFGFFGFGALICFVILFFSHYLVNLAGWEDLLLFGLGVLLILIELFVTPGFGVPGILGLLCLLAAAVMVFLAGDWDDVSLQNPLTLDAVQRVLLSTVLGIVVLLLLIRILPQSPKGRAGRLVLATTLGTEEGYTSHEDAGVSLVGEEGVALTPLRPSGRARVAGQRIEVETEGDFIDKGTPVRVLRQEGIRVVVRRV